MEGEEYDKIKVLKLIKWCEEVERNAKKEDLEWKTERKKMVDDINERIKKLNEVEEIINDLRLAI